VILPGEATLDYSTLLANSVLTQRSLSAAGSSDLRCSPGLVAARNQVELHFNIGAFFQVHQSH
jgi:hypothetical protein